MVTNDEVPATGVFLPPRIARALDEALRRKLTTIEAGAGYGKTALISAWIEERRIPCMWYSFNQVGIDRLEFLTSFGQELFKRFKGQCYPGLTTACSAWDDEHLVEILTGLGHELGTGRSLLVLDNLQEIPADGEIMQAVDSLISNWPGQVILCSRVALGHLPRLSALAEGMKLDEAVLAFKPEEISAIMVREFGTILSQEQIEWLWNQTEGWPLAINLAGRVLSANGSSWNPEAVTEVWNKQILPYFQTEVLDKFPMEKQKFLLTLAVPEQISQEVFGSCLGPDEFRINLEWVMRNHVFLNNVNPNAWCFNRMFHGFLRSKLQQSPKLHQNLNLGIGRCYLSMGQEEAAIACLIRAAAFAEAGQVLERFVPTLLANNRLEKIEGLLAIFPEHGDGYVSNALLSLGEALGNAGRGIDALPYLKRASLGFGQNRDDLGITRSLCAMGMVYAALGLREEAEAVYRQAEREELGDDRNRMVVISYINRYRQMVKPGLGDIPKLSLKCLGSFQICRGEVLLEHRRWRRRKALLVLKYLAAHPAHKAFKDQLLDLFWPDEPPEKASNSYYVTVHSLRRELSAGLPETVDYLEVERGVVALSPGLLADVDVDKFCFMYQEGRRLWSVSTDQAVQYFRSAANLYCGEFLDEDPYEEWLFPLRDQLKSQYIDSLAHMARHATGAGDLVEALELWNKVILQEGTNEFATREAMILLGRLGRRSEALQCYRRLWDRLKNELDTLPEIETQRVYQKLQKAQ